MLKSFVLATLQASLVMAMDEPTDESQLCYAKDDGSIWKWDDEEQMKGVCLTREDQAQLCYYKDDGSIWKWDEEQMKEVCQSLEEQERACVNDKGEWRTGSDDGPHCMSAFRVCQEKTDGSSWKLDNPFEVEDWVWDGYMEQPRQPEKYSGICLSPEEQEKEQERACVKDKGEWGFDDDKQHWRCISAYDLCKKLTDGSEWVEDEDFELHVWMDEDAKHGSCRSAEENDRICVNDFKGVWKFDDSQDKWRCFNPYELCLEKTDDSSWKWDEDCMTGVCLSPEEAERACLNDKGEWKFSDYEQKWRCFTAHDRCYERADETDGSEEWFEDEDEDFEEWDIDEWDESFEFVGGWVMDEDTKPGVYLSPEESERVCVNSGRFWNTYPNDQASCDDTKLEPVDDSTSLAMADAHTESNYSNAYTGAAFGVVGLAATFFLASTCNKKEVSERQQSLLDGYQSANHL